MIPRSVDERPSRSNAAVGLVRPIVNLRDATNAQVSRSAFLYALQHYRALQHDGYHLASAAATQENRLPGWAASPGRGEQAG